MHYDTAIIGGGASGMMAAITAARAGADVVLFEKGERIGKKLLSTGNGKCNFTNTMQDASCYRTGHPAFVMSALERFGKDELISFFDELGVPAKIKNGYAYPNSETATSILDVMRFELDRLGVRVVCDVKIFSAKKKGEVFEINTDKGRIESGRLIIATGGKAAPKTGSNGDGYKLARSFGHSITPIVPSLVPLECEGDFKGIAGVRVDVAMKLLSDGRELCTEEGQLQITDYGLSGIPVFQLSRIAGYELKEGKNVEIAIDYIPEISGEELIENLKSRKKYKECLACVDALAGLLNKKLISYVLKKAHVNGKYGAIKEDDFKRICDIIKGDIIKVSAPLGFDRAQTTAGGVPLDEIDDGFQSLKVPGLYFCGELLDVDGRCGGYNLQWAFTSGHLAAK